jgi:hypothetical protein
MLMRYFFIQDTFPRHLFYLDRGNAIPCIGYVEGMDKSTAKKKAKGMWRRCTRRLEKKRARQSGAPHTTPIIPD